MRVDIIGAGIGGLTMALALQNKDIDYRIFEKTNEIKPVGAGIILANNAMQVYKELGISNIIESSGNHINSMNITKPNLKVLSKMDLVYYEKKYKTKSIAIHRGILLQILKDKLHKDKIYLNKELISIDFESSHILKFKDLTQVESNFIIGADGIHSVIRNKIFKKTKLRKAKQICWRGVTNVDLPNKYTKELNEAWGKNNRFGFVKIAKNKVYWYALKTIKNNVNEYSKNELSYYFSNYNSIIKTIIESTPLKKIHTSEILDFKSINNWIKNDSICLLGDAAHAMTPNMGQGACQAIEDAYILTECLSKYSIPKALKEYQKIRIPKTKSITKASWMVGKLSHINNSILKFGIYLMIKLTPSFIIKKQSEKIYKIKNY